MLLKEIWTPERPFVSQPIPWDDEPEETRKPLDEIIQINMIDNIIDIDHPVGIHINRLYSYIQDIFDKPESMQYTIPMMAMTREIYRFINNWRLSHESIRKVHGGSYSLDKNGSYLPGWVVSEFRILGDRPPGTVIEYQIDEQEWIRIPWNTDIKNYSLLLSTKKNKTVSFRMQTPDHREYNVELVPGPGVYYIPLFWAGHGGIF